MHIQFCGAAQTVTGSCHLLTLDNGMKVLLDCGLYQGNEEDMAAFNYQWYFKPEEIDLLILSHAHIDHCGRIPKLVRDGFKGKIFCTSATRDLTAIMLIDSAHIQQSDAEYDAKKTGKVVKPLYTEEDVKFCLKFFVCVEYSEWFKINNNIELLFSDAGHILGSATVTLKITEGEKETFFGFTGDLGRYNRPILKDPVGMAELDFLVCESTYGGVTHEETPESDDKLLQIIKETCIDNKGKLIIPAFSVGRTQELLYRMDKLYTAGLLGEVKVYVDSPLAMNATEIFVMHPECYDEDINRFMEKDDNPFGWQNLFFTRNSEQSKRLNNSDEPCIIISASGMANAGRIKHHIFHQIEKPQNTILIVGYCAEGTLGEKLVKKPIEVEIFHEVKQVKARIEVLSSMSAHADQPEMLRFLSNQNKQTLKKLFLVHGEPKRQNAFKLALVAAGFTHVEIPVLGNIAEL